jgi:hypothetical protein
MIKEDEIQFLKDQQMSNSMNPMRAARGIAKNATRLQAPQ